MDEQEAYKAEEDYYDYDTPGATVYILCDCEEEHLGKVVGDEAQLLEWTCPKDGKLHRAVNA